MVHIACGICPAHGDTIIEISTNGKNGLSTKEDVLEVLKDIDDVPEISFPIYGNKYITKYLGDYAYINIVESPGVAFLAASRPPGGKAMNMIIAVLQTVPLIVLSACMAFMSGFIVWFLVSPEKSVAMVKRVLISYCMRRFILGCNKSENCPEQLEGYLITKTKIEIYATIKHPLFRKEDLSKCWCKRLRFTPSPQNLGKIMRISLLYRGIQYRR